MIIYILAGIAAIGLAVAFSGFLILVRQPHVPSKPHSGTSHKESPGLWRVDHIFDVAPSVQEASDLADMLGNAAEVWLETEGVVRAYTGPANVEVKHLSEREYIARLVLRELALTEALRRKLHSAVNPRGEDPDYATAEEGSYRSTIDWSSYNMSSVDFTGADPWTSSEAPSIETNRIGRKYPW